MKSKFNYILLLGVLALIFSFTVKPFNDNLRVVQSKQENCDLPNNVPMNLEQLSTMTSLYLNMNDNCNFQPIHYQVREGYPSTEIIARVFGNKTTEGDFALTKMELKHFEVANNPAKVIIDTAYITNLVDGKRLIKVKLTNLDEECKDCEYKKRLDSSGIDFVINLEVPILLNATTILDVDIENEKKIYPLFGLADFDESSRPWGRHCHTKLIY